MKERVYSLEACKYYKNWLPGDFLGLEEDKLDYSFVYNEPVIYFEFN